MTELVDVFSNDPTGSLFVPQTFKMKLSSVPANSTAKQSHIACSERVILYPRVSLAEGTFSGKHGWTD